MTGDATVTPAQDPQTPARDPYQPTTAVEAAARGAAGLRGAPNASEVIAGLRATSNADELVQLLSPEGVFTPRDDFPIEVTADLLRGLYRDMVLVRRFDREGNALQRQGQLSIWVPLLGQEAAQIGAGRALRPRDMAFPSYREHGVAWCRGIDPTELLGIFRGTDHCGWDPKATRFNSYTIVIGNQVLNATGYAMGQKFDGVIGSVGVAGFDGHATADTNEATIAFFGDGATSQGDVHEGMVFAAAFDAPRRFLLPEQPVGHQRAGRETVEGAAVGTVHRLRIPRRPGRRQRRAGLPRGDPVGAGGMRSGNGPVMVEAFTYRMDAHTTSDHPTRYRMAAEEEHWKLLDPIQRVRAHLSRQGLADQEFFDEVTAEADALAARFRAFCVAMEKPPPSRIFSAVYTEPHHQLADQERQYLTYVSGFADTDEPATRGGEPR